MSTVELTIAQVRPGSRRRRGSDYAPNRFEHPEPAAVPDARLIAADGRHARQRKR